MSSLTQRLAQLSAAEEFFQFFDLPYEQAVVHVNRLHILKRFYQYLRRETDLSGLTEPELFERYKGLLARAHEDFVHSTAAQEKVFKVFQDADGKQVSIESLRTTLPSQR